MPFKETCPVEERIAMLRDYDTGAFSVVELAARYGVSRDTFYLWKQRRESGDPEWFRARSHAVQSCPHAIDADLVDAILAIRDRFRFGPKKIRPRLAAQFPGRAIPAASTIGDILKRHGRIVERRRRARPVDRGSEIVGATAPNEEWSIDFKGWFRSKCGTRCDPLTIADTATRYLIDVRITEPTWAGVRGALEDVFDTHGLPGAIRSDNGAPFGSCGAGGLSSLSVWWLRLGIEPRYIPPASPQHNGRHERMHRTLKEATSRPPAATPQAQQARFDAFRTIYNTERPHEALGQTPPGDHWSASQRPWQGAEREPWYDAHHEVRRVRRSGEIKWRGGRVFIGEALARETVGLRELPDGSYHVSFFDRELGLIDPAMRFHRYAPPRALLCFAAEPK